MNKLRKRRKHLAPALLVAAGLLMSIPASAQSKGGGVLGKGITPEPVTQGGLFGNRSQGGAYSIATEQFGSNTNGGYQIGTELFGHELPLGSGLFIMAAAGAAYAFSKRKKNNKQHN